MSNWPKYRLGEIAPAAPADFPSNEQIVWNLSLEDIESATGRILRKVCAPVSSLGSSKVAFDERNVLYVKLRPYLNKVVVPKEAGVGSSELIPLCPNPELMDRDFLANLLRSPEFVNFAKRHMNGANLPRVSMREFWEKQIPVPPLSEQRRIAAKIRECLGRLEDLEPLQKESAEEASALLSAAINAVVEDTWSVRRLSEICTDIRNGWSGKQDDLGDLVGVLRLSCVHGLELDTSDVKDIRLSRRNARAFAIAPQDVFVVRGNGSKRLVGRSALVVGGAMGVIFNDLLIRLRFKQGVSPKFVNYMLHSKKVREHIESLSRTAAGIWKINQTNLGLVEIPVPEADVQSAVAAKLDEAKDAIAELAATTAEPDHEKLRQAILRTAFAGEL